MADWSAIAAGFNAGRQIYKEEDSYRRQRKKEDFNFKQQQKDAKYQEEIRKLQLQNTKLSSEVNLKNLNKAEMHEAISDLKYSGLFDSLNRVLKKADYKGLKGVSLAGDYETFKANYGTDPNFQQLDKQYQIRQKQLENLKQDPEFEANPNLSKMLVLDTSAGKVLGNVLDLEFQFDHKSREAREKAKAEILAKQQSLAEARKANLLKKQDNLEFDLMNSKAIQEVKSPGLNTYNQTVNIADDNTRLSTIRQQDNVTKRKGLDMELGKVSKTEKKSYEQARAKADSFRDIETARQFLTNPENISVATESAAGYLKNLWDKVNILEKNAEKIKESVKNGEISEVEAKRRLDRDVDKWFTENEEAVKSNKWVSTALSQFKAAIKADSGLAVSEFEFKQKMREMFGVDNLDSLLSTAKDGGIRFMAANYNTYVKNQAKSLMGKAKEYGRSNLPYIQENILSGLGLNSLDEINKKYSDENILRFNDKTIDTGFNNKIGNFDNQSSQELLNEIDFGDM